MTAYLLHVDAVTGAAEDQAGLHGLCEPFRLHADFFLLFSGKVDKMVIFGSDEERDCSFIEAASLAVPLLYRVESAFPGKVEHE